MDPEQVRQGREEEMNCMVKKLEMLEFGSWEEATSISNQDARVRGTTGWLRCNRWSCSLT